MERPRRGPAGETPHRAARARDVIDRQVSHLVKLLDDLLDATRSSRGKLALQRTPMLKSFFMDEARGVSGDLPELLRG